MKRLQKWMVIPGLLALLGVVGCGERVDPTMVASAAPMQTQFHFTKADSKSLAENVLWDYFDALNRQDLDTVMDLMNLDMQGVYQMQDRIALRNFKTAHVKRIYDMTAQVPKSAQYVEARYFYVEVDYELNHLLDVNDTDGENYRLGIVARETPRAGYKLVELSHIPKLREVSADTEEQPGESLVPSQNPALMIEGARK